MQAEDITVLTGWTEAVAEALAYIPERAQDLIADAGEGMPWRDALNLTEPTPGLTRGMKSIGRRLLPPHQTAAYRHLTRCLPALPAGQTLWARIYTGVTSGWGNWQDISFTTAPAGTSSGSALTNRQSTVTQLTAVAAQQPTPAWMRRLLRLEPGLHRPAVAPSPR